MKLRYKILGGLALTLALATIAFGLVLSHDSPCAQAPSLTDGKPTMQATMHRCYGSPDVVKLEPVEKPSAVEDLVLVRVRAAAVNPLDWHYLRGEPFIMRLATGLGAPEDGRLGVDFAGVVEAVGNKVTRFKAGDEVFGGGHGALAEYVLLSESRHLVHKPDNVSPEQAGSVAIAGVTALQAVRDHGRLKAGQRVLINGASGGVGTFAVQIAKSMGAEVTGVCSGRNAELVRSLGADQVIDYTLTDFTEGQQRFDLIIDMVGNHSLARLEGVLTEQGSAVIVGGPSTNRWIGPLSGALWAELRAPFSKHKMGFMLAELKSEDLQTLADLMQSGKLTPVIDRSFPLSETAQALSYLETGRARGKVVVTMN
jgi:NADPH:quinone reductase-like Zn-dependent oxidoreductase